MIFDIIEDYADALDTMPKDHPRHRILALLDEALRRDIHFIDRHPTTLFQCMWNTCWWYDCEEAKSHYSSSWFSPRSCRFDVSLHNAMEKFLDQKQLCQPGFFWIQMLTPPLERLGGGTLRFQHDAALRTVRFHSDGKRLIGADSAHVVFWDIGTGRSIDTHETDTIVDRSRGEQDWSVAADLLNECQARSVLKTQDMNIVSLGKEIKVGGSHQMEHDGRINELAVAPDHKRFASCSDDRTLSIWDIRSGKETDRWQFVHLPTTVDFSPSGEQVAVGFLNGEIRVLRLDRQSNMRHHTLKGDVNRYLLSPDGTQIAVTRASMTVAVWNIRTGSREQYLDLAFEKEKLEAALQEVSSWSSWPTADEYNGEEIDIAGNEVRVVDSNGRIVAWCQNEGIQRLIKVNDETFALAVGNYVQFVRLERGKPAESLPALAALDPCHWENPDKKDLLASEWRQGPWGLGVGIPLSICAFFLVRGFPNLWTVRFLIAGVATVGYITTVAQFGFGPYEQFNSRSITQRERVRKRYYAPLGVLYFMPFVVPFAVFFWPVFFTPLWSLPIWMLIGGLMGAGLRKALMLSGEKNNNPVQTAQNAPQELAVLAGTKLAGIFTAAGLFGVAFAWVTHTCGDIALLRYLATGMTVMAVATIGLMQLYGFVRAFRKFGDPRNARFVELCTWVGVTLLGVLVVMLPLDTSTFVYNHYSTLVIPPLWHIFWGVLFGLNALALAVVGRYALWWIVGFRPKAESEVSSGLPNETLSEQVSRSNDNQIGRELVLPILLAWIGGILGLALFYYQPSSQSTVGVALSILFLMPWGALLMTLALGLLANMTKLSSRLEDAPIVRALLISASVISGGLLGGYIGYRWPWITYSWILGCLGWPVLGATFGGGAGWLSTVIARRIYGVESAL